MTYGIAFCPLSEDARLRKLGFADSKTLTEAQRDRLLRVIKKSSDFLGWKVDSLSPVAISGGMLARSNYNLNAMSHDTAISLIRKCIADGVNVAEVRTTSVSRDFAHGERPRSSTSWVLSPSIAHAIDDDATGTLSPA